MAQSIQGHHVIPQAIYERCKVLFDNYLPGWKLDGDYNLDARPTSMIGSASVAWVLAPMLKSLTS